MPFYAVESGRTPGIYSTWEECKKEVVGFKNANYKKFDSLEDAEAFVNVNKQTEPKIKPVSIYVDGSFNKEKNIYGYGVFMTITDRNSKQAKLTKVILQGQGIEKDFAKMRNVAGELLGIYNALSTLMTLSLTKKQREKIYIFYDYAGIANWLNGNWQAKTDYTQEYLKWFNKLQHAHPDYKFFWKHINAHTGNKGNELVDSLAKEACGIKETKITFPKYSGIDDDWESFNEEHSIIHNEGIFGHDYIISYSSFEKTYKVKDKKLPEEYYKDVWTI